MFLDERDKIIIDDRIDLRGEICPLTFVKVKLKLEELKPGQYLEVLLDDGEPVLNVPRSVKDEGYRIVKMESLGEAYRLIIQKMSNYK